jgi:hypothetical protein
MQDAKYIWETWVFSGSMVNFRTKRELFCSFFFTYTFLQLLRNGRFVKAVLDMTSEIP